MNNETQSLFNSYCCSLRIFYSALIHLSFTTPLPRPVPYSSNLLVSCFGLCDLLLKQGQNTRSYILLLVFLFKIDFFHMIHSDHSFSSLSSSQIQPHFLTTQILTLSLFLLLENRGNWTNKQTKKPRIA